MEKVISKKSSDPHQKMVRGFFCYLKSNNKK